MRALIVGRRDRQDMAPAPRKRSHGWSPRPDQPGAPPADTDHVKSERAGRSPAPGPQPFRKIAREAGFSLGPVARIAKAKGPSRLSARDQTIEISGDEQPGEMIPIDIKKLGRIEGIGHHMTGNRKEQSAPRRQFPFA